jgi:hypothetical protein
MLQIACRGALLAAVAACSLGLLGAGAPASAADPIVLRISTPPVPADWHAEMLPVFQDELEKSAPGEFDVQIYLNAPLFKQGTEPAATQRGNLDMALISAQDIAKQIPAYSIFTAGYLIRDPGHRISPPFDPRGARSSPWLPLGGQVGALVYLALLGRAPFARSGARRVTLRRRRSAPCRPARPSRRRWRDRRAPRCRPAACPG